MGIDLDEDTSTLEILSLEEDVENTAKCIDGRGYDNCPNAPVWLAKRPCCPASFLICQPCKDYMLRVVTSQNPWEFSCAYCKTFPFREATWSKV